MAFDPTQILLGAFVTAVLGVVAFFGRRIVTKESAREKASLYGSYATIASTLKSQGLTMDDVDRIAALLRTNERQRKVVAAETKAAETKAADTDSVSPYWTQAAMNTRAYAAEEVSEAQLKAAIAEFYGLLSPDEEGPFAAAQAAWAEYRDKEAAFRVTEFAGGTMASSVLSAEREFLNRQRIAALQALAEELGPRLSA